MAAPLLPPLLRSENSQCCASAASDTLRRISLRSRRPRGVNSMQRPDLLDLPAEVLVNIASHLSLPERHVGMPG